METKYKQQKELLEEDEFVEANKTHIRNFLKLLDANNNLSWDRRRKYTCFLRQIAKIKDKDFNKMNKEDLIDIVSEITNRGYSHWTVKDYKVVIKRFWRWLYDMEKGQYPKQVSWISHKKKKNNDDLEVFSRKEIKKIINATTNMRDKAFFYVLYDAQSREGELLSCDLNDVEFKEDGSCWITLKSKKSGKQAVKLYESSPYLSNWLHEHPFYPEKPNKPLWVTKTSPPRRVGYQTMRRKFWELCKKTGVDKNHKKCHMHDFGRKSRTTHLIQDGVPVEFVKRRGRWSANSKVMETTYSKITQSDVSDVMDQHKGIKKKEEKETEKVKPCPKCNTPLPPKGKFCMNCGAPRDVKAECDKKEEVIKSLFGSKKEFLDHVEDMIKKESKRK